MNTDLQKHFQTHKQQLFALTEKLEDAIPEDNLIKVLPEIRDRFFIISNAERIMRVCNEWKNLVELERKARTLSIDELNSNLDKFTQYMEKIGKNSNRLSYLLEEIKGRLLQYYDDQTEAFIRDRASIIRDKINHNFKSDGG